MMNYLLHACTKHHKFLGKKSRTHTPIIKATDITMEIHSPLVKEHSEEDQARTLDPPRTLYVSDDKARFPLIEELDENSDRASEYDLCMVFKVEEGTTQLPQHAVNFCRKMIDNGLDIFLFYGIQKLQVFVLIRASFDVSACGCDLTAQCSLLTGHCSLCVHDEFLVICGRGHWYAVVLLY